ncbi:5'(3')-deoxyribonucleotidase, cytosolic type-like [Symsagittifera roscoffensis]|uniref:5'(3')-deoxyribonucleotidase, cytosolic type-like n=1 Tax=Symsagittifera roscoffensis TaxID=84072 RepID=UPI00307B5586
MASLMKGGSRSDKSKIVLVDMDGVIVDYELGYERAVSALFPGMDLIPREERKVFYSDVQYSELYPEHREEFQRIAVTPRFFRDMPIMKGAKEALEKLNGRYTLFICSAPMTLFHDCVREKYEWVEEHLGFEFTKQIILTRDKTVVSGKINRL